MIQLILSTDMMTHFSLTDELNECVTRLFTPLRSVTEMEKIILPDRDRMIVLRSILHGADISNPAKIWTSCKQWSDLVVEEFFSQGDLEKKEKLPVSMNMDRCVSYQDEISLGFNDFIVAPFFFTLLKALPKLEKAVRYLDSNRDEWDRIMRNRLEGTESSNVDSSDTLLKWAEKKVIFSSKLKDALSVSSSKLDNKLTTAGS